MSKTPISSSILWLIFSLLMGHQAIAQGTLRVGAAHLDITPPSDPANPPAGKYAHEKLYVRAIVLDTGATTCRSDRRRPGRSVGDNLAGCFEANRSGTEMPYREHYYVGHTYPQWLGSGWFSCAH